MALVGIHIIASCEKKDKENLKGIKLAKFGGGGGGWGRCKKVWHHSFVYNINT